MKAPVVALAFACAAFAEPDPAIADPIRASAGSTACALDHSARLDDEDATFRNYTGLENSAHFANTGSIALWGDDGTRIDQWIDFDGFGLGLHKHITLALRKHDKDKIKGGKGGGHGKINLPGAERGPGSQNPEPEAIVLIATGLAGAFVFRRQLFA